MLNVNGIKQQILNDITIEHISKIFLQIINDEKIGKLTTNQPSIELLNIYVNALALINEFIKVDCSWSSFQTSLLQNRQIHIILAQALINCDKQTKYLIIEMTKVFDFPKEQLCELLENFQTTSTLTINETRRQLFPNNNNSPILTLQQIQNLDTILNKLKTTATTQELLTNTTTCDIIELYEYKLLTNNYNQRLLENNIETLNDNVLRLKHHINQLKNETNHYHQLLFNSEKLQIDNRKINELLKKDITDLTNRIESYKGKLKIQQQEFNEKSNEYEERIKESNEINNKLELENNQLKQCINKIQENANKLEQKLQTKDESIKQSECTIYNLNMQVKELEESLRIKNEQLNSLSHELKEVKLEALAKKRIVDAITKLATSQHNVTDSS